MGPKRVPNKSGPKYFQGEFSFVNKDASNIDSKEHNAHVSWHVVNRYERWKKQEHSKNSQKSDEAQYAVSGSSASLDTALVRPKKKHRPRGLLTRPQPIANETLLTSYPPSPWNVANAELSMMESTSIGSPLQNEAFAIGTDQLLENIPGPVHANSITSFQDFLASTEFPPLIARILAYTSETTIPTLWPYDSGTYKWQYEISRTLDELAAIVVDPCYASATLCFYATVMASITGDADVASQACFFQSQAMTELQQRVRPQPGGYNPFTLKAILRLFSAETALDNTSTARIHLKMLRNIITLEGGVILLDSWLRENLLAADCYFALKYETRPLFPASEWTPGPLSQHWKTRLASARLIGDHSQNVDAAVDGVLKTIVVDLRELFRVQRYVNLYEISPDDQLLRWRQLRKFDCLSRLADHQLGVKIYSHLFERPKLQSAICIAVALLTALVLGGPEPTRFEPKLISDLKDRIAEARTQLGQEDVGLDPTDRPDAGKVIYWLLCVGVLGERTHAILEHEIWFEQERKNVAVQLGLTSHAEDLAVNKHFLCSQTLLEDLELGRNKQRTGSIHGVYEACGTSWREAGNAIDE